MRIIRKALRTVKNRALLIKNKTERAIHPIQKTKLHLGCGNIRMQGFCNVDILMTPAVDVLSDISKLENFDDQSVELIYACHVLEHFSHEEAVSVLRRWYEVLSPGGEIRISVPDIDRIVKIYMDNWEHFQVPSHAPWIGLLYGGQGDLYDFHKTGFNFCWIKYLMDGIGYEDIREYSHEPHFIQGVEDASLAKEPFGQYISLNIMARKPA